MLQQSVPRIPSIIERTYPIPKAFVFTAHFKYARSRGKFTTKSAYYLNIRIDKLDGHSRPEINYLWLHKAHNIKYFYSRAILHSQQNVINKNFYITLYCIVVPLGFLLRNQYLGPI